MLSAGTAHANGDVGPVALYYFRQPGFQKIDEVLFESINLLFC